MNHKCSQCEYNSKFSYNVRRHFDRKHGIEIKELPENATQLPENATQLPENATQIPENATVNSIECNSKTLHKNQCDKCEKIFAKYCTKVKHIENCKGKINKLQCNYCNEIFTLHQAKYRHQKTCKLKTKNDLTSSDLVIQNINTQNNITNNIDNRQIINNDNRQITNNITLQIRNFGDENKDYLTNAFLLQCYKNGYYGLVEMIENVYFNKEHPENHNVRIGSLKNKYLEIHKDDKWVPQGVNETLNRMINTTATDIILNVDDSQKEIEKIMEIQNLDTKKEKLLKESINGKLIARKKLKNNNLEIKDIQENNEQK